MFAYPCPSCSQRLLAPPERAGQRTICPKCLTPVTVPSPDEPPVDQFDPAENQGVDVDTPIPVGSDLSRDLALAEIDLGREKELAATLPIIEMGPIHVGDPPRATARPQPAPQPVRVNPGRPTPRDREGQVVLNPTGLFAVDVAAELSCAISMRMAPPPETTTDRTTASVGWVAGVVAGIGLWVMGVVHSPAWFPYVALAGAGLIAFGFLWRAYLSGRGGNWLGGLATLLPPVCVVQLLRPIGDHGLRPLRFVLTGAALVGLFAVGPAAHAWVEQTVGLKGEAAEQPKADPAKTTPTEQAVAAAERLGDKKEREAARQTLLKLGADAEPAVLPLLTGKSEGVVLTACDVLEQIGGEKALAELWKLADDPATTRAVRVEAATAADAISKRLSGAK